MLANSDKPLEERRRIWKSSCSTLHIAYVSDEMFNTVCGSRKMPFRMAKIGAKVCMTLEKTRQNSSEPLGSERGSQDIKARKISFCNLFVGMRKKRVYQRFHGISISGITTERPSTHIIGDAPSEMEVTALNFPASFFTRKYQRYCSVAHKRDNTASHVFGNGIEGFSPAFRGMFSPLS